MTPKIKRPPSKLATLKKAISAVLPGGLPKEVARFYAKSDGLSVTHGKETAVLVGLAEMFGGVRKGAFRAHAPVKLRDIDELEWLDRPFYETFFNEHGDVHDKRSLDQLNLRMRLKLLSSVAGESVELAIDFFDREPRAYLVQRADSAYPLNDLGFDELVAWFSKFGTRRWYYAFLDKKAGAAMNIDLRAELQRSLEDFPAETWAPLLARFPEERAPTVKASRVELGSPTHVAVDRLAFPAAKEAPLIIDEDAPRTVAFSADGRQLVVWGGNYGLCVIDVGARERTWKMKNARAFALSPDGQTLAVLEPTQSNAPADRVVLRSCTTGKPLHRAPWKSPKGGEVNAVAFASGGKTLVVADAGASLRVVEVESQRELKALSRVEHVRRLGSVGGTALVIAHVQRFDAGSGELTGPSAVKVFDTESGAEVRRWDKARAFGVSADGTLVALRFPGKPSTLQVVELASGRVVQKLDGGLTKAGENPDYGFHLCFSPDGSRLVVSERRLEPASGEVPSTLTVLETKNWSTVERIELGRNPKRPAFTIDADGIAVSRDNLLCAATDSHGLRLWRL